MPTLIETPTVIEAAGNKPKIIREYVGHVNSATSNVSVAHMQSPERREAFSNAHGLLFPYPVNIQQFGVD